MLGFNDSALLASVRDYFSSRPEVRLYARTSYGFANQAESQHFDGLIVRVHNEADRSLIRSSKCPVVSLLDDQAESWPQVRMDNKHMGQLAVHTLQRAGCEQLFAFGLHSRLWSSHRLTGFAEAAKASQVPAKVIANRKYTGDPYGPNAESIRQSFYRRLQNASGPVGLFGVDHATVVNLIQLIESSPVALPTLEITGLHERDDVSPLEGRVHKIKRPMSQLAQRAANMLDTLIAGRPLPQREYIFQATVTAQSEQPFGDKVTDDTVRRLLDFLQRYYDENLGIDDICRLMNVNRRSLERACREHLVMTPLQALQRIRLQHARKLLLT